MKLKIYKLNFLEIVVFLLLILIIFSEALYKNIGSIILYVDDLCILLIEIMSIYLVMFKKSEKIKNSEKAIFLFMLFLSFIGFLGNLNTGYQDNIFAMIVDFFGWHKFFLAYICFIICLKSENIAKYYQIILSVTKKIIVIGVILEIFNLLKIINLTPGYERFGINSFSFGGHASAASFILAAFTSVLLYEHKKNRVWIVLALFLEVCTFRFKAIAFLALVIFCMFFMKKKFSILKMIIIGIFIVCIVWEQIVFYFFASDASRAMALNASIEIANDEFPIGAGFATFGTNMSGKYYSDAYKIYGLSNRWGFLENHYQYIGDGGVANIIGQFGYLGLLIFVILFVLLFKSVGKRWDSQKDIISYICIIGYMLISITNEAGACAAYAIILAFVLAVLVKVQDKNLKKVNITKEIC